jgi:hypothetical protein
VSLTDESENRRKTMNKAEPIDTWQIHKKLEPAPKNLCPAPVVNPDL